MKAKRPQTRAVYNVRWAAYVSWCTGKNLDPKTCPIQDVLDFLQEKATGAYSTVQGYLTVLNKHHAPVPTVKSGREVLVRLRKTAAVKYWLRGLRCEKAESRVVVPPWDLEVVLNALKRFPFHPLEKIDLKHLTLKTVFLVAITSARRAAEIHALERDTLIFRPDGVSAFVRPGFKHKVNTPWHASRPIEFPAMRQEDGPELQSLCVHRALKQYLKATQVHRAASGTNQLFVCYGRGQIGQPVSKIRISEWLKLAVRLAYKLAGENQPRNVKGHQVRKLATSWATLAQVDPQAICDAATWQSSCSFARHYKLDLAHSARSMFGRSVLQAAASSSLSAAPSSQNRPRTSAVTRSQEPHLPPALAPTQGRDRIRSVQTTLPPGYRIPRLIPKRK